MHLLFSGLEVPVLSATITWAQRGPWVADLILDATSAPEGGVIIEEGALRLRGTVSISGEFAGRARARVVGGAGGIGTKVQARQYRDAPLSLVLGDIGSETGETIRPATPELGAVQLELWARPAAAPSRVLDDLCRILGEAYSWRTTDSGAVEIGPEAWPTAEPSRARVLEEDLGHDVLVVDDELLELRPGTVWEGKRLSAVQVQWGAQQTRTKVWVLRGAGAGAGTTEGRGLGELMARVVESRLPSPLWTRLHPAVVHSQDPSNFTLQVFPESADIPPMVEVPLHTGLPGLEVEVHQGAKVLLAFVGGDPRHPVALPAFERDTKKLKALRITATTEVTVEAPKVTVEGATVAVGGGSGNEVLLGDTPANPVARVGDLVQIALQILVPDPTQGVLLNAGPTPVTGTIGSPGLPVIAVGQILSGRSSVKA